jgi:hypothetical protein
MAMAATMVRAMASVTATARVTVMATATAMVMAMKIETETLIVQWRRQQGQDSKGSSDRLWQR